MDCYCLDCDDWFVSEDPEARDENGDTVCPFCAGGNWEGFGEDDEHPDPLAYVEDWEDR